MSARAKSLQRLYNAGRVSVDGLRQAVADGQITPSEFEIITGQVYA